MALDTQPDPWAIPYCELPLHLPHLASNCSLILLITDLLSSLHSTSCRSDLDNAAGLEYLVRKLYNCKHCLSDLNRDLDTLGTAADYPQTVLCNMIAVWLIFFHENETSIHLEISTTIEIDPHSDF